MADNPKKYIAMFSVHSDPLAPLGSQEGGGQNMYVRSLVEELTKLDWEIDIFTRWDSLQRRQFAKINKKARIIRLKGGNIGFIPKNELFTVVNEIYENFLAFVNYKNPYALFHSHYWDGGAVGLMAKEKFKKPLVHNFHSLGITRLESMKRYLKDETVQNHFAERINHESKIITGSDKIICLAEAGKKDLEKYYACPPEKILVIPGGVNLKSWPLVEKEAARKYLLAKPEDFIILFVGRLEWGKGLGTLLAAINLVRQEVSNLKFLIVGGKIFGRNKNSADLAEYDRLQAMVEKKHMGNFVRFVGNIENRALSYFYRAADLFCVPSYYEGFGLVALEGMANKIPVLASNTGGLASIIKPNETGFLAEPKDPEDLKNKIVKIYKDRELAQQVTEKAYQEVTEKYSWKKIAEDISRSYEELIKTKRNEKA